MTRVERIDNGLDPLQGVVYTYDANGNQTSKTKGSVSTVFDYDIRDKLVTVTQGAATLGRFTYDYQGLRIRRRLRARSFATFTTIKAFCYRPMTPAPRLPSTTTGRIGCSP